MKQDYEKDDEILRLELNNRVDLMEKEMTNRIDQAIKDNQVFLANLQSEISKKDAGETSREIRYVLYLIAVVGAAFTIYGVVVN